MLTESRKPPADPARTRITGYALLTVLVVLGLFACMAYLRYWTG
jgi:hypothetical protein